MIFIPAKHFTIANRKDLRLVVIHTMQAVEKPKTAKAVANWFAGKTAKAPMASAHLCVDAAEVIECVKPKDIAYGAPGANSDGYHIELTGYAEQTTDQWHDAYSLATLALAAKAVAPICIRYGISPYWLTTEQVADKATKGFCGHNQVSKAFKKSDHTDPGPNFPWAEFLTAVASEIEALGVGGA